MSDTLDDKSFTADDLAKKDSDLKLKILSLSFEYLLADVSQEYNDILQREGRAISIEEFNILNRLDMLKVLVYPFFVALSDGNSKSLFNLFGKFKTYSFGPGSASVYTQILKPGADPVRPLKYFKINPVTYPIGLQVSKDFNFKEIKEEILAEKVDLLNHEKAEFRELNLESDNGTFNPIYKAIEAGVEVLQQESSKKFFASTEREILFRANFIPAFQKGYNSNKIDTITYNDVEMPRSLLRREFV